MLRSKNFSLHIYMTLSSGLAVFLLLANFLFFIMSRNSMSYDQIRTCQANLRLMPLADTWHSRWLQADISQKIEICSAIPFTVYAFSFALFVLSSHILIYSFYWVFMKVKEAKSLAATLLMCASGLIIILLPPSESTLYRDRHPFNSTFSFFMLSVFGQFMFIVAIEFYRINERNSGLPRP